MFNFNGIRIDDDASMLKERKLKKHLKLATIFSDMMLGKEYDDSIDLGDIEALTGVCEIPCTY